MRIYSKAIIFMIAACLLFSLAGLAAASVTDISGHWAQGTIEKWTSSGLASGYPDGTFKPDNRITRAEFVTLVNKSFNKQNSGAASDFPDVSPADWYYREVASGKAAGYISGYPDGAFGPGNPISRQEVASIIVRLKGLSAGNVDPVKSFTDIGSFPAWSRSGINAVVAAGIMSGYPDGSFRAENPITRAEAVVTLDRALGTESTPQTTTPETFEGIKGTVSKDGQPLSGVSVKLFARDGYEVLKASTTDSEGAYGFAAGPGAYDLTAAKEDYLGYAGAVTVTKGNTTNGDISLVKGVRVSGTIVDSSGNPFKNVEAVFTTNPTFITNTDGKGKFSLCLLPNRSYSLRSFIPGKTGQGLQDIARDMEIGDKDINLGNVKAGFSISTSAGGGGGGSGSPHSDAAYVLSFADATGGTVSTNVAGSYKEDSVINLTAIPNEGYLFVEWKSDNGGVFGNKNNADTTFKMPPSNVVISAVFAEASNIPPPVITIAAGDTEVITPLYSFAGTVTDEAGITKVSYGLNVEGEIEPVYLDIFVKDDNEAEATKYYEFDVKDIELADGNNEIVIVATNALGRIANKSITVNYIAPAIKAFTAEDIVRDEETQILYVKNQILITAKDGVTKEQIEQLIAPYNGVIVGSILITNDYQVELQQDVTMERLEEIVAELEANELVELAGINFVSETSVDMIPNDSVWNGFGQDWKSSEDADGRNWGVEAINAPAAWDYDNEMSVIKVGLIDIMFDTNHEDLSFKRVFNNPATINDSHGTHVAGTMAADSNNEKGITGIVWNKELYGFAMTVTGRDIEDRFQIKNVQGIFEWKYALTTLIVRDVKVINISMYQPDIGDRELSKGAKSISSCLKKLINRGYDFVICHSAGNGGNNLDTTENRYMARITDEQVENRIIIVGAIEHERVDDWYSLGITQHTAYPYADFSQTGARVDVAAPGVDISSCVVNNGYEQQDWDGTSMAAPHVTGVAAMVWAVNSELTGEQVKRIVVETADRPVTLNGRNYPIVNALAAVERARSATPDLPPELVETGILMGIVGAAPDGVNKISDAQVSVYKEYGSGSTATTEYTASTRTDDNGEFELILPGGRYSLIVTASGYLPFQSYQDIFNNQIAYTEPFLTIADNGNISQTGIAGGYIKDAFTGSAISDVRLKFCVGWNNTSGDYVQSDSDDVVVTNNSGGYYEVNLRVGNYTVEAQRQGYVTGYFNIVVLVPTSDESRESLLAQHGVITPILEEGLTRMILTWGETPRDLDSHLTGPTLSDERFHVYYSAKTHYEDGVEYADLDVDDTTSYGPETTTIYTQIPGVYRFSVHDFSNRSSSGSTAMSLSGAQVKVQRGDTIVATYNVPTNQVGTVWKVFEINGNDIIPINTMSNESNPGNISSFSLNRAGAAASADEADMFYNLPPKDDEQDQDTAPFVVSDTDPADNAGDVSISNNITIAFSKNIQPGSQFTSITVLDVNGSTVSQSTYLSDNKIIIDPTDNLLYQTSYTVHIPKGAVRDDLGNGIAHDLTFTFITQPKANLETVEVSYNPERTGERLDVVTASRMPAPWSSGDPEHAWTLHTREPGERNGSR